VCGPSPSAQPTTLHGNNNSIEWHAVDEGRGLTGNRNDEMDTDLRARVVALEHNFAADRQRLTVMEQWRAQMDVFNARRDEQFENLKGRFDSLDKKIDGVNTNLSADMEKVNDTLTWLARLIIGTIITCGIGGVIGLLFKLSA
jgi:predicted nuclease with TOPRIM domain